MTFPYPSIERLLRVSPESKSRLYTRLFEASLFDINYTLELLLAAGIAVLGLVLGSPAVVIGAMLVSPLMGPILATGLALAASDVYLGIKCLINITLSVAIAVLFSAMIVWILPFHAATAEILARTRPNLLDLGVALFSGIAGSLVVCRGGSGGGVTALPGVAIAVALMPPLCTVGFGFGSGVDWDIISGAALLFLTNLAAIVACAFVVFVLIRIRSRDVRQAIGVMEREYGSHDRVYALLQKTHLRKAFDQVGQLRWRVSMLVVILAILFVPLRKSLVQVRDETIARTAMHDALMSLGPPDALLNQQLDILPDRILASLVSTESIDAERVRQAERLVIARTGKATSIHVRQVASRDEIALLRAALSAPPPPPPPPPQTLLAMRQEMLSRMEAPLKESWPAERAALDGYDLILAPEAITARIRYTSRTPLDSGARDVLTQVLRTRLKEEHLEVVLEREPLKPSRTKK